MNIPDRKQQPKFVEINDINIKEAQKTVLPNGVPLYIINAGVQEVLKLDLIFEAGNWYQPKKNIASNTATMLNEGTKKYSAYEIAEKLDFYGAYLTADNERYTTTVSLYSLNKHLEKTIEVLNEVIKNPTFPENELKTSIARKKQQFLIELNKVESKARRRFLEVIFGKQHPFGNLKTIEDYDNISVDDLKNYYQKHYHSGNVKIIVSGKITQEIIDIISSYFGKDWGTKQPIEPKIVESAPAKELKHFIPKEDAVQSAIRIGKKLVGRTHEDFFGLQILNTILGGYFGSRLMSNVREDKGYTYGIYSMIIPYRTGGYMGISTEVGVDVCQAAINEIYKEIATLRKKPISDIELKIVKNYILGDVLRMFDGPFSQADSFKMLLDYGLDYSYHHKFVKKVKTITKEEIMNLANKYLAEDTFFEIVAGKK